MATGNRTLKLSILADVDDLKKKLGEADKAVEDNASGIANFSKKAAAAFAVAAVAAAAYATKLAVDGVKAAIEDEAAQLRLASALRTATGATDSQVKATEAYISKTALAVGIADDQLRPAFQRLAIATGDVTKSQELLSLAIDLSKGTGKDLGAVTEALSKSFNGQDTQLVRLGIGLTAAQAKTMDFKDQTQLLTDLYGGAASRNAETFQGRIDRLKVGFNEAKEAVGFALLPIIEKLIGYIFDYGVPIINKFKDAFEIIKSALDRNRDTFAEFGNLLKNEIFPILQTVFGFLLNVGAKAASAIIDAFGKIVGAITPVLNFIIGAINKVIDALNLVKIGTNISKVSPIGSSGSNFTYSAPTGGASAGGGFAGGGGSAGSGGGGGSGGGSSSFDQLMKQLQGNTAGARNLLNEQLQKQGQIDAGNASIINNALALNQDPDRQRAQRLAAITLEAMKAEDPAAFGITNNIYVSGSIDPEGTARAVATTLNSQAARSVTALRDR